MKSQSLEEKNTEVNRVSKVFFVTFRGGKTRGEERGERKRSERFSWCEHRWRGDGKIIESRLSHRRTKEIFHRPTNFLAKWSCIKIAGGEEGDGEENESKNSRNREARRGAQCSGNRKRELKTRRSINTMIIITIIGGKPHSSND